MKLPNKLFVLLALGALLHVCQGAPVSAAAATGPTVWILVFYSPDCPQCDPIRDIVTTLRMESNIRTRSFNIDVDGNYALYKALEAIHGSEPFAVPLVIVGEHILIGVEQIRRELHPIIESYRFTGAKLPYLGPWGAKAVHSRDE